MGPKTCFTIEWKSGTSERYTTPAAWKDVALGFWSDELNLCKACRESSIAALANWKPWTGPDRECVVEDGDPCWGWKVSRAQLMRVGVKRIELFANAG